MLKRKKIICLLVSLLLVAMLIPLTSCNGDEKKIDDDPDISLEPRFGGILRIANSADPGYLDVQHGTGEPLRNIGEHMAEYLFDWDSTFTLRPGLADSHDASEDGLVHTVKLREGVLFHNLEEMTAEDVVASVKRWLDIRPSPPELKEILESVEAVDRYTVEFRIKHPHEGFLHILGPGTYLVIYPKELCEKYGRDPIPDNEIVGTGPYKLKEYIHDRFAHLVRFEEYVAREEEPDGWFGKKYAYVDEIISHIIPDQSVRTMGVEAGDYHYGHAIEYGDYQRIIDLPGVSPLVVAPYALIGAVMNCSMPPWDNVKVRLAAQAAVDASIIMESMYTYPELYDLDCSYFQPEIVDWYSKAGCDYYNQANPELAKKLLAESGYDGTTIKVIGITEYAFLRNGAIIYAKQLEDAGFNVELLLSDVGTWVARYLNPTQWHTGVVTSVMTVASPLPAYTKEGHVGWWSLPDDRHITLGEQLRKESDYESKFAIWEELQQARYETGAYIKFGNGKSVAIVSDDFMDTWDYMPKMPLPRWWNVWLRG